ncbi:MAG: DUF1634 domain-containing protein [Oenococcus sp.]|uniref:DUF1634 domain-containing protein n=1 Tax=Oenococcus TaxID=46254 RepID=UPI0021E94F9A|nr:DUF1634 domain-containing protein [Oenococcus kitaharae]MCV3296923.1 DUF1634 domain-containing protein [Oenococcus kitaharae]
MVEEDTTKTSEMTSIEIMIGKILRIGVILSGTIITIGVIILSLQQNQQANTLPTSLTSLVHDLCSLEPYAIIMLGLFLLILTPVLRVAASIYAFFRGGDKLYGYITTLVLIILFCGMALGFAEM